MSSIFQTPELAVGIAVGSAAGAAFDPKIEVPKQKAWKANPVLIPDIGVIAALLAGGKLAPDDALDFSERLGFAADKLDALTWLAQNRLDFAIMLRLWRRFGAFDSADDAALEALMDETLAHEQLDWDYEPWLKRLKTAELPGIGDIAYGIVRGMLPAPSWVPVAPPATTTNVKRFPVVDIDPVKLAAALGFSEEMLKLMVGRSGLSMAPGLAAQAHFRGILEADDYLLAVAEGDLRTEWGDALLDVSRQILTAGEYAELELRGFYDAETRRKHTAKHGMSDDDSNLLYDVLGRAPAIHTIVQGLARGGIYNGPTDHIPAEFLAAMQRSNERPEWYSIIYAARYTYPSPFQMRGLAEAGDLGTVADVKQLLLEIGWKPELAAKVSAKWVPAGATADPHIKKAQGQLWTSLHSSYIKGEIGTSAATAALPTAAVAADAIPDVLAVWDVERATTRAQLSVAQIQKALKKGVVNPATGVAWTDADATSAFLERGYDQADAATLIAEA